MITVLDFFGGNATIQGGGGADSIDFTGATVSPDKSSVVQVPTALIVGGAIFWWFNRLCQLIGPICQLWTLSLLPVLRAAQVVSKLAFLELEHYHSPSAVTTTLTTGIAAGDGLSGGVVIDDGFVVSGDWASEGTTAGGVTARTVTDQQSNTLGETFVFADGSNNAYLFIQGGSSGTADDLVVNLPADSINSADGGQPLKEFTSGMVSFT